MIFIGIDPDLHTTAIAVADLEKVYHLEVVRVPSKLKGHDAVLALRQPLNEALWYCWCKATDMLSQGTSVFVESQRVYKRHDKANPNSLILLAQVAGACVAQAQEFFDDSVTTQLVYPQDWKGQVSKEINQRRTYQHYGWESKEAKGYCVPTSATGFSVRDSDWKHLGDALGIALWAAKEHARKVRIEKRRGA